MSVLIKDMEMPTSCDDCRLNNGISCYAVPEYTEDDVVGRTDDRPDYCPLIPVPAHGRLIDADALRQDWLENGENEYVYDTNAFLHSLDDAPTIIPADGKGTDVHTREEGE